MNAEIQCAELSRLLTAAAWTGATVLTLTARAGEIEVYAVGHDREVRAAAKALVDSEGTVQVSTSLLKRLLEGFRDEALRVTLYPGDTWLALQQGVRRLRTIARSELVSPAPFEASETRLSLDQEDWQAEARRLSWVTSEQVAGKREVAFEPDGVFAFNSRAAVWVEKAGGAVSVVIPEPLSTAGPGKVVVHQDRFAELTTPAGAVFRHSLPAQPQFQRGIVDRLFAADVVVCGKASVSAFAETLRAVSKHDAAHRVRVSTQGKALHIQMVTGSSTAEDFLDLASPGQPFSVFMDGILLAHAVLASHAEEVEFGRVLFPQLPHPLLWLGAPGYRAILAPMTPEEPPL